MKHIIKSYTNNQVPDIGATYLTVTSVLFRKEDLASTRNLIVKLKCDYWPHEGLFCYKDGVTRKVHLHTEEIRRKDGPFSYGVIEYEPFMHSLTTVMGSLPTSITSCTINKYNLYCKYKDFSKEPYSLSLEFILERLVDHQLKDSDEMILILESRGKKEDKYILDQIIWFIDHGSYYVSNKQFSKIKGVYFNPKRPLGDETKTYFGLEIADLCSYPIHRFCKLKEKNRPFIVIEHKLHCFPSYFGRGLKIFP